jgi:hypothetical protein
LGGAKDEVVVGERWSMAWGIEWLIGRQIASVCRNGRMEFGRHVLLYLGTVGHWGSRKMGFEGVENTKAEGKMPKNKKIKKVLIHGKLHSSWVRSQVFVITNYLNHREYV